MYTTNANDGRTVDDYPLESSPSTGTFETAELNHAEDAHTVSEYHEPPEDSTTTIMFRDTSTLEVAL